MSKKKSKFNLSDLVHHGYLKDGETLCFVSDPAKTCKISKTPAGEYKVTCDGEVMTIHACAQKWLSQDPPQHASKWIRTQNGKTLYDIWGEESGEAEAA